MFYNLRHLEYVVAVADGGSITEASRRLHVSQPAISAAIRNCEDAFGVTIFARRPARGLSLTPAGREFVDHAQQLLEQAADMAHHFQGLTTQQVGHVEVACYAFAAPMILPRVVQTLTRRHPQFSIGIQEGNFDEVVQYLRSGRSEIAVTYDIQIDSDLEVVRLASMKPYVMLSAKDPLAVRDSVSLAQLAERPMILLDIPGYREFFQSYFSLNGLEPRIEYRLKTFELVRALVGVGGAYSFGFLRPRNQRSYDGRALVYQDLSEKVPEAGIVLALNKHYRMSHTARLFAEACQETVRKVVDHPIG